MSRAADRPERLYDHVLMKKRVVMAAVALGAFVLPFVGTAHAATVPPACVVATVGSAHLQLGFAPHGPADCTKLL